MCGSRVDIQSPTAEIRRGKKKKKKEETQDEYIMSASVTQGGHYEVYSVPFCDQQQTATQMVGFQSKHIQHIRQNISRPSLADARQSCGVTSIISNTCQSETDDTQ